MSSPSSSLSDFLGFHSVTSRHSTSPENNSTSKEYKGGGPAAPTHPAEAVLPVPPWTSASQSTARCSLIGPRSLSKQSSGAKSSVVSARSSCPGSPRFSFATVVGDGAELWDPAPGEDDVGTPRSAASTRSNTPMSLSLQHADVAVGSNTPMSLQAGGELSLSALQQAGELSLSALQPGELSARPLQRGGA